MKTFRCALALLPILLCACGRDAAAPQRNIVVILVDDMRYDAIGALNSFYETPNIDQLVRDGVLFENAFVTTSLCSPSRATILTGLVAPLHGIADITMRSEPTAPMFPELLRRAGYETAFIGKWHIGRGDAARPGFDRWISFPGQGEYFNQEFNVDGKHVRTEGHNADSVTNFAVDYLKAPHAKPFMLFVSHKAVHAGFRPADRYAGLYDGRDVPRPATMTDATRDRGKPDWVGAQRTSWLGVDGRYPDAGEYDAFVRRYAETVRTVDDSIGRIVESLRERALLDSTLIVFTSDNGFMMGEHGLLAKRAMYEESIRVPMIVRCPELVAGGQRRAQLVLNLDICPTLLDAADVPIPEEVHGRSMLPLLADAAAPWRDGFVYTYFWDRWMPQTPTTLGLRTDRYKLIRYYGIFDRTELYDLSVDPRETNNLLADYFTPSGRETVDVILNKPDTPAELRDLFATLDRRLDADLRALGIGTEPTWNATGVADAEPLVHGEDGE